MNDYRFDDPELQKRYEEFCSNMESLLDLSAEAMILRAMINRSLNAQRDRLALDALSQLQKTVATILEQQKQLKLLLTHNEVREVVNAFLGALWDVLEHNYGGEVASQLVDEIKVAANQRQQQMLLEVNHE